MPNLRKGASPGPRVAKLAAPSKPLELKPSDPRRVPEDIRFLIDTSVTDCRSACVHATREQLIDAHRWCERNPDGQKSRKEVIATALRKREVTAETERNLKGGRP
jgi:hypothetical protein